MRYKYRYKYRQAPPRVIFVPVLRKSISSVWFFLFGFLGAYTMMSMMNSPTLKYKARALYQKAATYNPLAELTPNELKPKARKATYAQHRFNKLKKKPIN